MNRAINVHYIFSFEQKTYLMYNYQIFTLNINYTEKFVKIYF